MYVTGKSDFLNWVNNQKFTELLYPVEDQYLPRRIFGQYLRYLFNQSINRAKALGCSINLIAESVDSVTQEGKSYILNSQEVKFGSYGHLFVCNGNDISADQYNLKNSPGYYESPYPVSNFLNFEEGARVGIIGSRLSAVDLVIELYNRKPALNFTMLSRSSGLPYSAGLPFASSKLEHFNPQNIDKHRCKNGFLSLKTAARLVNRDLRSVGIEQGILSVFNSTSQGGLSGDSLNVCNIREVLLAAGEHLPYAWQRMSQTDQSIFFNRYKTPWVLARLTMPGSSATKIQHLIDCKVLAVTSGITDISYKHGGFEVSYGNGNCRQFDYLINCTGIKRHCDDLSSPLVRSLLYSGLCTRHPYGGVIIEPHTHFALDTKGQVNENLTVVGQLAVGNYFMTNSVDGVMLQVDNAMAGYIGSFSQLTNVE